MGIKRRVAGESDKSLRKKAAKTHSTDLVLVHVTTCGAAREIIRSGSIETRKCNVFNKPLAYFFALRPAYKNKGANEKHSLLDYFPFIFLIKPNSLGPPFHVYPFDTGGAISGAYDEEASDWVYLEDYELDPDLGSAEGHIQWAFGTHLAYYDGELRGDLPDTIAEWDAAPMTFARIARLASLGHNQPDERASAVEIAYNQHIRLKGNCLTAIMPKQFLEDMQGSNLDAIDSLKAMHIDWTFYNWQPNLAPSNFHRELNHLVRDELIRVGIL